VRHESRGEVRYEDGEAARAGSPRGVRLFTIAGIPIRIDGSWLLIFALVLWSISAVYLPSKFPEIRPATAWLAGLFATALFFGSLLIHELAHSVVARRHGIPVSGITLFLFGGMSRIDQEPSDPGVELRIALVGPLASFALAGGFWLAANALRTDVPTIGVVVLEYLAWINAALGAFNLVPGFPLDGGRALRAAVWWQTGSLQRATRLASNLGKGFAVGMIVLGVLEMFGGALVGGLWLVFIGLFLRGMASAGYEELVMRSALEGVSVGEVMTRDPISVAPGLTLRELVDEHLLRDGVRGYPVCEGEKVLGVISLTELGPVPREQLATQLVRDVMVPLGARLVVRPSDSLLSALRKMAREHRSQLLVMEGDHLVGVVTRTAVQRVLEIRRLLGEGLELEEAQR
jgi:Zn-dependent protease